MLITLKFDSVCRKCGNSLPKGLLAHYEPKVGCSCYECKKVVSRPVLGSKKAVLKQEQRQTNLNLMEDRRKAFYEEVPDFTWSRCAKGELLETLQKARRDLF